MKSRNRNTKSRKREDNQGQESLGRVGDRGKQKKTDGTYALMHVVLPPLTRSKRTEGSKD